MSATADYVEQKKREELAALASGGERARQEWLAAESAANARSQASIAAELDFARSRNFDQGAQDEIARIIGAGSRPSMDAMARRREIGDAYTSSLSSAEGSYLDRVKATVPALERELAESLASAGGGGGGGRGGRGGGSDDDWYKTLREDAGGLKSFIPDFLASTSRGFGDPSMPRDLRARAFARDVYGVPEFALDQISPIRGFLKEGTEQLAQAKAQGVRQRRFIRDTREYARSVPGDQRKAVAYLAGQARQVLPVTTKPKAKRRG